jgi:hypothetical protein
MVDKYVKNDGSAADLAIFDIFLRLYRAID